jgi:hypothetical protein
MSSKAGRTLSSSTARVLADAYFCELNIRVSIVGMIALAIANPTSLMSIATARNSSPLFGKYVSPILPDILSRWMSATGDSVSPSSSSRMMAALWFDD